MKSHIISTNKIQIVISFWFLQLLGLVIFLGGFFDFGYLSIQYTIVCKEKQVNLAQQCTLESNLYSLYHSTTKLGHLTQAVVMSGRSSKGGSTYWVDLFTDKDRVNLAGGSSSGRANKDAAAEAINNYISKSIEPRFEIPYPSPWWAYAFAGFFSLIGVFLIIGTRNATLDFDRILKSVFIKRKSLLSSEETKLMFSDIDRVIIEESRGTKGSLTYRLAFALKNKSFLPFVTTYDSNYTKKEKIAKQLNDFMCIG